MGSDSFEKIRVGSLFLILKKSTRFIVFQREGFEPIQSENFASFKVFVPDKKISDIRSSDLIKQEKDYKSYAEKLKNRFQQLLSRLKKTKIQKFFYKPKTLKTPS